MAEWILQLYFTPDDEWNPDPEVTSLVFTGGWTALPDLSRFTYLRSLYCRSNQLTKLPDLSALKGLRVLDCHSNQLTELPNLTCFVDLWKLWLHGNLLSRPPDLTGLDLDSLTYSGNPFAKEFPDIPVHTYDERIRHVTNIYRLSPKYASESRIRIRLVLLLVVDLLFDPLSDLTDAL
jgi:hypothetical protein